MELKERIGAIFIVDGMKQSIAVDLVQKALEDSGLNKELAAAIQKRGCFSRAKGQLETEGLILEVAKRDDRGFWLWQLSDKYINDQKLETKYRSQFWYDPDTCTIGATDPDLLTEIEALFAEYGGLYLANDLMRLVHKIFVACNGLLPLRRHGGVYFVPEVHRNTLEKIMTFLQKIGCVDCVVTNVGTMGEGSLRDKAVAMLVESTNANLKDIQNELKKLEADGKEMKTRRAKGRWNYLQEQLARIRTFASALGVGAEKIMQDASTSEIKLATIAAGDLDTMAAMAQRADFTGGLMLSKIIKAAQGGDVLPGVKVEEKAQETKLDFDAQQAAELPADLMEVEIEL